VFTGLVDAVGVIESVAETAAGRELRIAAPYEDLALGESVAVNGACLTVTGYLDGDAAGGRRGFTVAAVDTTLGRTTLGSWRIGRRVNLERAMRLGDRLGGHMVLGHVDGVARAERIAPTSDATLIDLVLPAGLDELMVPHGSLAVDGVSLTVNELPGADRVQLSIIEYTLQHTTLGTLQEGDEVHVEADVIGKYVRRLVTPWAGPTTTAMSRSQ
jgi:riboflavin synthase